VGHGLGGGGDQEAREVEGGQRAVEVEEARRPGRWRWGSGRWPEGRVS